MRKLFQKALENGEVQQGLQVSGIGYVGKSDYNFKIVLDVKKAMCYDKQAEKLVES